MTRTSKNTTQKTLLLYWQHAWRYPKYVIALLAVGPVTILLHETIPALIAGRVLDRLSSGQHRDEPFMQAFGNDLLLYGIILMFGGVVMWRIAILLIWKLEMRVTRDLARRCFDHYLVLSANFHANSFGGSLVSQTNKFVASYVRIADTTYFQVYMLVLTLILSSIVLIDRAPLVVAFLWIVTIVYTYLMVLITRTTRQFTAREARAQNKVTGVLADAITNVMAVKSFSMLAGEKKRFARVTETSMQATNDVMQATTRKDIYAATFTIGLMIVALVLAVVSVTRFGAAASTVFIVYAYALSLSRRLWEINSQALRNFNRAIGDARDMVLTLGLEPEVKDPERPEPARIKNGEITFRDVTFTHDNANQADSLFTAFNLHIAKGEKIGLVGHSGAGKTSFTRLLLRFSDIDSGEILIDGQNIAHITQEDLRRHIAYVPQEPLLFHRSIAENIAYGKPGATQEEIALAAKHAHAHEFIETLPQKYDTLVGERGVKLSGGQRQRIAIARAMLKDAPILVLDEATSALDSESERLIQDALWKLMQGRTAIVIAHRLSTIQKMDRIVVLDNGTIAEEGSHKTLLAQNGIYASLWAHQSGGFIEE